jgi:hypothetical protein
MFKDLKLCFFSGHLSMSSQHRNGGSHHPTSVSPQGVPMGSSSNNNLGGTDLDMIDIRGGGAMTSEVMGHHHHATSNQIIR